MWIEGLEGRALLSATLSNGVLTITGTDNRDTILVSLSKNGHTLTVSELEHQDAVLASIPGAPLPEPTITRFDLDAAPVSKIVITGGGNNDLIRLLGSRTRPINIPASIDGGEGQDELNGGGGNDTILGGAGNDRIWGFEGDDLLRGGDSRDEINGGNGADTMYGDDGDDRIDAVDHAGHDVVFGGTDDTMLPKRKNVRRLPTVGDIAEIDPDDAVSGIETLRTIVGRHRTGATKIVIAAAS
jgi:Ca2+-binding RTX toxin-like protein